MGYMKKTSSPWFYRSACAWASEGRDKEALAHLDIAIKLGFTEYDRIKSDKEWDALRGNPEFQALVEKVREVGDYLYILKKSPAYREDARPMPAFTYPTAYGQQFGTCAPLFQFGQHSRWRRRNQPNQESDVLAA